ncbi:hypothetical protein GOP47_0001226, partial [Adiantum capillus-veneris]
LASTLLPLHHLSMPHSSPSLFPSSPASIPFHAPPAPTTSSSLSHSFSRAFCKALRQKLVVYGLCYVGRDYHTSLQFYKPAPPSSALVAIAVLLKMARTGERERERERQRERERGSDCTPLACSCAAIHRTGVPKLDRRLHEENRCSPFYLQNSVAKFLPGRPCLTGSANKRELEARIVLELNIRMPTQTK